MNVLLNAYYKGGTSTGGPLSISAANTGTAFDTSVLGGVGEAVCVVTIGAIAADATALKIQESDDNSNWTDVSGGAFSGTGLPPRRPSSAVISRVESQSWIRFARLSGENPPNTTEWIAPIRVQASMAEAASGTIGI